MKEDTIEKLFKQLQGGFDIQEPEQGHEQRFIDKLNASKGVVGLTPRKNRTWLKYGTVAAAVVLLFSVGYLQLNTPDTVDEQVAKISPEASKTEFYFASLIEEQVKELQSEATPETEKIINDTMAQLKKLELNYAKMEQDLVNGGNSKLILSAMITNFQTRIDLLNEVMIQIETIKNLKNANNENYTI